MSLVVICAIWFAYIARLSQCGGKGVFYLLKLFIPAFAAATGGGRERKHPMQRRLYIGLLVPPPAPAYMLRIRSRITIQKYSLHLLKTYERFVHQNTDIVESRIFAVSSPSSAHQNQFISRTMS